MKIDLRVLDHLGIKLYSNAAAVLSEAVANAWDADTQNVQITITQSEIVVKDDGIGMDLNAINERFLSVGYDKRATEGTKSPIGRAFMGRKGIGKLSLFSIAEEVTIHTTKNGENHAFRMSISEIEAAIRRDNVYHPTPVPFAGPKVGTRIVLAKLKQRRLALAAAGLRKRIARRFSVIGYKGPKGDKFSVSINGAPIGPQDRDDLKKVEFLWEFGAARINKADCPCLLHSDVISDEVSKKPLWKVRGWIAAAARPIDLRNDESGSMNGIVVVARGRLIQENLLDKLNFNRILNSYVTGQVEADFLDTDKEDDIATSDRQRLVEDDERYITLLAFLRQSLLNVSDSWSTLRNEVRGKEVQTENPALAEWIGALPSSQQSAARTMLGTIQGIEVDDVDERKALYKAGVLAFERLRLRDASHRLSLLPELTAAKLLPLMSDLSDLEGSMYRDIVRERLTVIQQFVGLVDANEKEKVLAQCIFEQMWLLDAGWERATGSERIEQTLKKDYSAFSPTLTDKESKGRVDIRYRTNAGQHIIVELKRAKRKIGVNELSEQGNRYKVALTKCLRKQNGPDYVPNVSIVFILGVEVNEADNPDFVRAVLDATGARLVYYDQLIASAQASYAAYLKSTEKVDALENLLKKL
ncbi:MAG: ATP-binding protein [Rubrivivax sp.]|nr:ATP-binding protein [Rubrivivax sp.]